MNHYVITIGRQFGSGGRELGRVLSQKLGIPFYDKELLYQAAQQAGMSPDFFVENDEKAPTFLNSLMPFSFGMNPLPWTSSSTALSDDNLYHAQSDFIRDLASRGSCIIVGRSADYVLRDMPNVVSVFVHANRADCVARIVGRADTPDSEKANRMCDRINKLRANYYNFYTDKRWGDAASYDLTFNSSALPIEDIADIVVEYVNRRFTLTAPQNTEVRGASDPLSK